MDQSQPEKKTNILHSLESHIIALYGELKGYPERPIAKKNTKAKANELFVAINYVFKEKKPASPRFLLELSDILLAVSDKKGYLTENRNQPAVIQDFMENCSDFLLANKTILHDMQKKEMPLFNQGRIKDSLAKKLITAIGSFNKSAKARRAMRDFIFQNHEIWYDHNSPDSPVHDQVVQEGLMLNNNKQKKVYQSDHTSMSLMGKNLSIVTDTQGGVPRHSLYQLKDDKIQKVLSL